MAKPRKKNTALSKGASAMAKARAASLTPERRSEIARKAITTRWEKAKKQK
jgi:hypothetical protein